MGLGKWGVRSFGIGGGLIGELVRMVLRIVKVFWVVGVGLLRSFWAGVVVGLKV